MTIGQLLYEVSIVECILEVVLAEEFAEGDVGRVSHGLGKCGAELAVELTLLDVLYTPWIFLGGSDQRVEIHYLCLRARGRVSMLQGGGGAL